MGVTAEQEHKGHWILKVRHRCKDMKGGGGGGSQDASPGRADTGAGVTLEGCQARGDLDAFSRALSWLGTTGRTATTLPKTEGMPGCTWVHSPLSAREHSHDLFSKRKVLS